MTAIDIATARKVLQVPKDATKKDIEKAFRNLSKKLHPDKLSDAKRTAEANERFAEAFNAKDLLLRYLQHLEEEGKVLSSSSCSNVPNADPPIPRKKDRQSASRSAPRDKENKPYSAPYSAEEERKQEDEFKEAWRKVAEMLAREKGVPYENPLKEALPKAREKSKKPSTAAPSKKGVQVPSEKVAPAPFKNGTVKDSLQPQKKHVKKAEDPFQEALPKAREKSKKPSTAAPSKKGVQAASEKVAAAPSFKNGTVKDSLSPQKKPLKNSRIIENVDDSLPHPKKPVKRRFIVEDEDSSDGSCCTSSKSYINSCATGGSNGSGDGNGRAQAPSSHSHGSSRGGSHGNNNPSNGWGGNGGWGYGGPPSNPPSGGGGSSNDGSGGNRGYPSSGQNKDNKRKHKHSNYYNDQSNSKSLKGSRSSSPSGRNYTPTGNSRGYFSSNNYNGLPGGPAYPSTPPAGYDHRGRHAGGSWVSQTNNNWAGNRSAPPNTPPLVGSPPKNCNGWNRNNNNWGTTDDNFKRNGWEVNRLPVFDQLIPPLPNAHKDAPSQLQVPINEGLRDKIYHQLAKVCGDDKCQLERYVPTEILSLTQQEEEQWDAKKKDAAEYAIGCVIELMNQNFGDEVDSEDVEVIKDFFTCLKGNYVFDIGFRVDQGNDAIKCLCPCW
jgi:curved DNA-binding protein CbpA